jgi:hypothetical protein
MATKLDPEGYCAASDHPRWNQSFYFNFYDPAARTGAFIRFGILENLKQANHWFVFFRDGRPLFSRLNMTLPYTDRRLTEGLEIGGVKARAIEPLRKVQISFDQPDFKVDLVWDAILPMMDAIHLTGGGDEDPFAKAIAHVHLEGTCRVTGTITLSTGETIAIDGKGFRDIAVGPRDWDFLRHYRLTWPIFDNGLAVVAVHGISTTGAHAHMKMVGKNGRWVAVDKVEDRNVYEADEMTLKELRWRVTDAEGETHSYTGRTLYRFLFPFDTFVLTEHMMEYRLDNGTVGYGLGECGFRFPWAGNGE